MIPMTWFKLFWEWGSDPKVQSMSEALQRRLVMLWCLRCQADLTQLTEPEIALYLHISLPELKKTRALFVEKGFLEPDWSLPKFEARQTPADPTAAERMRNYRKRHAQRDRNVTRNGPVALLAPAHAGGAEEPGGAEPGSGPDEHTGGARAPADSRHVTDDANADAAPTPMSMTRVRDTPGHPDEPELAPAWVPLQRLAVELGGDPSWHAWTRRMAALGFPPDWVEQVLRTLAGRGQLRPALAHGILEHYRNQGGPDRREDRPRGPRSAAAPGEPRRLGAIMPRLPEGPAGDALRKLWESTAEVPPAEGPP